MTIGELNPHKYVLLTAIEGNLTALARAITRLEENWGSPFTVTSGLRSMEDQLRINPTSMHSMHLTGCAADLYDPERKLQTWVLAHEAVMEGIGLWCEHFSATPTWVHAQIKSPPSGHRFFYP